MNTQPPQAPAGSVQHVAQESKKYPPAFVKYELVVPIGEGDARKTALELRRPKVRDIKAAYQQHGEGMDAELFLLGNCTGLMPDQIDELDSADLAGLQNLMVGFRQAPSKP